MKGKLFLNLSSTLKRFHPTLFGAVIGSTPRGILMINIKQKNSFENNFHTHAGEHLTIGVFPIFGNF